ncbi:DUF5590 domain-containing protein [Cohnella lubricantis]|uniref:DUF5590 domain-containing protein n=1 Tax=Cohnella lubricantis TaxID=2163172 RepID=A0A841TE08_9BACL|nr:DUF5590 domain-containing protein [Cohnella lubricantis]MBB6679673.1 DUF5590 domain-containing protein [Cohnella lubricantis]MBP2119915.1 uncharacterized protein YpmB [Cohnella lubricantis]
MSLSRMEERRRDPVMSARRWTLLILGFLVFLCVIFVIYIKSAGADYQNEKNGAIRLAKQEAGIVKPAEAVKHVWEESVWVVSGKDADGVKWFVWERQDGLVKERADDGLSEDEAKQRFTEEHPGKQIVRVMPGWFENQPAWEIRYISDPETERQAIDFYAFKDGMKLKTYDLPGK